MAIGSTLPQLAKQQPDKPALVFEDKVIPYKQFNKTVSRIRNGLKKRFPNKKQATIALAIENEPAFLEMFFAVTTLGWIAAPLDPNWTGREADEILRLVKPDAVISSERFLKQTAWTLPTSLPMDTLKQAPASERMEILAPFSKEPFYFGFTSGTTGTPKAYTRSHHSWLASFKAAEEVFQLTKDASVLAPGPLYHSLSLCAAVHALQLGATFQIIPSEPRAIRTALREQNNTFLFAVPSVFYQLVRDRENAKNESKHTFIAAGDQLHPELINKLQDLYPNSTLFEYYGASELSYVSYTAHHKNADPGNKPFPGVTISIRTEDGTPALPGEPGQIYVNSDFLFSGYIGLPEETGNVLTPLGSTVGDIGRFERSGAFTIIGRKKNMLITGGRNVYPEEVEKVIKAVPAVREAIVTGETDPIRGEKIVAFIQWKDEPDVDTVRAHCKKQLAAYKIPKTFFTVSDFPRTSSGKIDRSKLKRKRQTT